VREGIRMAATNVEYTHEYNPNGAAGYFLTFHTYGTWLHGDERGSIDRKGYNIPGTPVRVPNSTLAKIEIRPGFPFLTVGARY
jgi:hypothetical protein